MKKVLTKKPNLTFMSKAKYNQVT